jgi:hypothetical protein
MRWLAPLLMMMSQSAFAAEITSFTSNEGREIIVLSGEISPGDADRVSALMKAANDGGRSVSGVRLDSKGGNLVEGIKLSEVIRFARVATVVANGKLCASACFIAFAAGAEKFVSRSAFVGVHGASDRNGNETTVSNAATVTMARAVRELGVPSAIIGKMVVTPPTEMVWLSENELRAMGTTMTGKPAQTATQAVGGPFVPITPQTGASTQASRQPQASWATVFESAVNLSRQQNDGTVRFNRSCQPELKLCSSAVFFRNKEGKEAMMRRTENIMGETIRRDICEFNAFKDIRRCTDWETGVETTAMKDSDGNWKRVD